MSSDDCIHPKPADVRAPRDPESNLTSVLTARRTVRAFTDGCIPRDVVETAIEAAGWAPSPHGKQPWRFAIVEDRRRRQALADSMAQDWKQQLELDGQDPETVATRLAKGKERLMNPPFLVIACLFPVGLDNYPDAQRQDAELTMAVQSLGAAVQNLLLSIQGQGYDAGWMCAPLFCPDVVREVLDLPAQCVPHALIPVGVAAREPKRRDRLDPDQLVISWE